jgi:Arc/MetJ-type ribon-helix-helix transcriptional regulator
MPIVNFKVNQKLNQRIENVIKEKGFSSKAEFFRYVALYWFDSGQNEKVDYDKEIKKLTQKIGEKIIEKYGNKKIASLEEQLSDI